MDCARRGVVERMGRTNSAGAFARWKNLRAGPKGDGVSVSVSVECECLGERKREAER